MPRKQPKTNQQNRAIFGLAAQRGFAEEDLRQLCEQEFSSRSISSLDFNQSNHLIGKLGGQPFAAVGLSRRTIQYHRQKSGVAQLPTAAQTTLMRDLARQRGISDDGLAALCVKILKHDKPRTTTETGKVVEALKSMIARDKITATAKREAA